MSDFKGKLGQAGYNPEEMYFHEKNQELIKKQKRSHLTLLQGGKGNQLKLLPAGASDRSKKAA